MHRYIFNDTDNVKKLQTGNYVQIKLRTTFFI